MNHREALVLASALAAVVGVLVACGSSSDDDGPATDAPRAEPTPDASLPPVDAPADDAVTPACTGKTGGGGEVTLSLMVGTLTRTAHVHVPPGYDNARAMPAVLAFHGFTANAADVREISHFDHLGDTRGFLAVFPEGTNGSWNAGPCCGTAQLGGVDDLGFVKALVAEISARWCVDARRVFAAGFSNGGFLAHRLGCEMAGTFAAIGVVSGQQGMATCNPPRPVPVLQIHGTSDPVVPYGGNPALGFPSAKDSVSGWAKRDMCGATTTEIRRDGETHCDSFGPCAQGADVVLCTVEGGGHDWPRGGSVWDGGVPPPGFVASTTILDFFDQHPM